MPRGERRLHTMETEIRPGMEVLEKPAEMHAFPVWKTFTWRVPIIPVVVIMRVEAVTCCLLKRLKSS